MKKKLEKRLANLLERRKALGEKSDKSENIKEVRSLGLDMDILDEDIAEVRALIAELPGETNPAQAQPGEQRAVVTPQGQLQPMGTFGMQQRNETLPEDEFSSVEYRAAFMDFARTGRRSAELINVQPENRADAMTATTDASAVIPTTILKEVIKKVEVYGQVFARVRKLNVQGGLDIPIIAVKPVATWITEATPSDKQKQEANTKVSFTYFGLECKVAVSLLVNAVSLTGFETTIVDLIVEAMVKAIDIAVVKGTGSGSPTGITVDTRVPASQKVTLTPTEFASWKSWKQKVFAKLKLGYKAGAVFLMASGTYEGYIDGMTDTTGQPIGRTNYGIADGPQGRFGGREVIEVEDDVIANYDDASTGDVVAILVNLKNYGWNSNMQLVMFRYLDQDTNEYVDKAILIADGKLLDANGVVIVKKGAAS